MAVKKKFPYRSALVACNGGCHVQEGQSCENGCIGCGICTKNCPEGAIKVENFNATIDQSKCIGCGICEKTCTAGAIKVTEHCAVIDESVCLSCGMCVVKCPRHVLTDLRGIIC